MRFRIFLSVFEIPECHLRLCSSDYRHAVSCRKNKPDAYKASGLFYPASQNGANQQNVRCKSGAVANRDLQTHLNPAPNKKRRTWRKMNLRNRNRFLL